MNFDKFFQALSYLVVLCGFASLWVSGSFGILITFSFIGSVISAWYLEDTKWQLSERVGTALIFVIVPLFYVAWKYKFITFATNEIALAGVLSRLILGLCVIKLLQKKADRD